MLANFEIGVGEKIKRTNLRIFRNSYKLFLTANIQPTTFIICDGALPFMQAKPTKIKAFLFFQRANRTSDTTIFFAFSFAKRLAFGALLNANSLPQIILR